MLASHLHLPTAAWGGHMGHFLLSVLILTSSTPLGNMASRSAELNSNFLVQDKQAAQTCSRRLTCIRGGLNAI